MTALKQTNIQMGYILNQKQETSEKVTESTLQ